MTLETTTDAPDKLSAASVTEYDTGTIEAAIRRLYASRIIKEIEAAHDVPMGLPILAAWFEREGREWLDGAGMEHLADLPADELARIALDGLGGAKSNPSKRCANCTSLFGDERVRCGEDMWRERGHLAEYARGTVANSSRAPFDGCEYFERKGP